MHFIIAFLQTASDPKVSTGEICLPIWALIAVMTPIGTVIGLLWRRANSLEDRMNKWLEMTLFKKGLNPNED